MKHSLCMIALLCASLGVAQDSVAARDRQGAKSQPTPTEPATAPEEAGIGKGYTPYAGGKALIQQYCISCHASSYGGDGSGIYTREYRKVRSLAGLKAQVTSCNTMLNLKWFDDEELQVVNYLNQTYYHF